MKHIFLFTILLGLFSVAFAQHTIEIELKTDNYGSETTWEVVNTLNNDVLAEGGPYTNVSAVQTIAPIDVDGTGCYAFYIYDEYGDGICCNYGSGYYKVYYDDVMIGQGGEFSSEASVMGMGSGCPQNEIELIANNTLPWTARQGDYAVTGQNTNIKGRIINNGVVTLTSFQVTYNIDGGENLAPQTITCNATMGQTVNFTYNLNPAVFSTDGPYVVNIIVSNPNGVEDDDSDNTSSVNIIANSNSVSRNVLLEHFTTAECPNCPAAITNLTNWTNTRPNIIWLSHHAGYYTDDLTIPENTQLLLFYNAGGSTYAPGIMLDRKFLSPDGDPGPVFFPASSYTTGLMDQMRNEPAYVSLEMEGNYNTETGLLNLTVSGEFLGTVAGTPRLSVYIQEDGLVGEQAGASNNYTHNHSMRDAITANYGDATAIPNGNTGTTFTKTYTYTVDSEWVLGNLTLIAFVNDWNNSNVNDREIYNSIKMPLSDFVSIADEYSENIMIFPNPASDMITITGVENASVNIFSVTGQLVFSDNCNSNEITVTTANLSEGTYIVKVVKDSSTIVKKVIVTK
ncbi:MAG TPA: Omp28-related outer membrane protein [Bacteroidales bacterium]|nr:Omp28-related outer membrane protein [Bacteroidales bacterium]